MIKTILLSISASLAVIAVAFSLFMNPILGAFGLATTSVDTMRSLQSSKQIVQKMKASHKQKRVNVAKKIARRSGKRVASTVLAAATIGTVAVAVTVASLEVSDYCEEKKELQEDYNILYGTNTEFDLDLCLEEGKEESKAILNEVKNSATSVVSDAMSSSAKYSSEKWEAVKAASIQTLDSTNKAAAELWDSAKSWLDGKESIDQ